LEKIKKQANPGGRFRYMAIPIDFFIQKCSYTKYINKEGAVFAKEIKIVGQRVTQTCKRRENNG
jgi:hypothetical protein